MDNQQPSFQVYISSDGRRYYIGVQSSLNPRYLGSFADKTFKPVYKFIIAWFLSREEAGKYEEELIRSFGAIRDPGFVNRAITPVDSIDNIRERQIRALSNEEVRNKISNSVKALWEDPSYISKQRYSKRNHSERMKEIWSDETYRKEISKKISESIKGNPRHLEAMSKLDRTQCAESTKKFFENLKNNPEEYKKFMEERGRKISEAKARKKAQRLSQSGVESSDSKREE